VTARQGVFDFNKKTVARDGVVDPKKHKTFMDTFGHKLEKFFPESDIAELRRVGGLKLQQKGCPLKTRQNSIMDSEHFAARGSRSEPMSRSYGGDTLKDTPDLSKMTDSQVHDYKRSLFKTLQPGR